MLRRKPKVATHQVVDVFALPNCSIGIHECSIAAARLGNPLRGNDRFTGNIDAGHNPSTSVKLDTQAASPATNIKGFTIFKIVDRFQHPFTECKNMTVYILFID